MLGLLKGVSFHSFIYKKIKSIYTNHMNLHTVVTCLFKFVDDMTLVKRSLPGNIFFHMFHS